VSFLPEITTWRTSSWQHNNKAESRFENSTDVLQGVGGDIGHLHDMFKICNSTAKQHWPTKRWPPKWILFLCSFSYQN